MTRTSGRKKPVPSRTGRHRFHPPAPEVLQFGRDLPGPILGPIGRLICDAVDPATGTESLTSLAAAAGTTQPTLTRILAGAVDPKASVLGKLADHFGVSLQPAVTVSPAVIAGSPGKRASKASGTAPETGRTGRKPRRR